MGIAVLAVGIEVRPPEALLRPGAAGRRGRCRCGAAWAFLDDLPDRHARRQAAEGVLEHDLHVPSQRAQPPRRPALDLLVAKADAALAPDQAQERQAERGLARAALATTPTVRRAGRTSTPSTALTTVWRSSPRWIGKCTLTCGREHHRRLPRDRAAAPWARREKVLRVAVPGTLEHVLDGAVLDDPAVGHDTPDPRSCARSRSWVISSIAMPRRCCRSAAASGSAPGW